MKEPIESKILSKKNLNKWLTELKEYQIIAPVQRDNYSEFTLIKNLSDIDLNIRATILSPKEYIFEQTIAMFKFKLNKTNAEPQLDEGAFNNSLKQILFGIRPCDSQGIASFDPTFNAEYKDPYYLAKRTNTILVGLACNEPDINCFCTSVAGGPFDGSNVDILMVDIGQAYFFNIYTKSGQQLVAPNQELFETPTEAQQQEVEKLKSDAKATSTRKMDTTGKPKKLDEMFDSDYWDTISKKCLGCGICTYLCPTCYCFDITDETQGSRGERVRTWDSCMYPEYTVHASGYNPRPARLNRLRNRVYHKFKYYPDLYNQFGCTGCGRCIRHCPVNIDIIDIVNGIR